MDIAANGGTPYSKEHILTIAFDAMYHTGFYNKKHIAWEDLTNAQKTWLRRKIFFTKIVRDYNCLQQAAGSHFQANSTMQETHQQDTIDALVNLVSATSDDCNAVANLTSANATLASQIKKLTEHSTKHKEELDSMKTNSADTLSLLEDTMVCPRNNSRGGQGGQGGCEGCSNYQQRSLNRQQRSDYHMSANCENRKAGHRENATALNHTGGSTRGLE
eukprot:8990056-Ditylum_brightwellii.AAC.1